ncbi:MAG TPA: hypothetical protein PKA13_05500 [Geminicoccaceae bacterium]|nr:hypothetical protein [Geminicoccus sp.]HMU49208.1 hypothetical protein [Geminicoccaceae bacterium]
MALAAVHYEIQLRRGDRWVIEAVLHDREAALELARAMADRSDADGVRMVKECASAVDDATSVLTLFQVMRPKPKPQRRRTPPPQRVASPPPERPDAAERPLQVDPRPPPKPPWWETTAGLGGIAAGACVILVGALSLLV